MRALPTRTPNPAVCLLLLATACAGPAASGPPGAEDPPAPSFDAAAERGAVAAVLDDWHAAAAEADEPRYLGHFAPDAVFLGTDASERWTLEQFTGYVQAHFPRGGWTYHPHDRFVMLSADGRLAWFDEALTHGAYGELRGTGVLRKHDDAWRIVHYNMTFTVPNDVARQVVEVVQAWAAEGPEGEGEDGD